MTQVRERSVLYALRRTGEIPVPTVTVWMRKDCGGSVLSQCIFTGIFYSEEHRTGIPLS